MERERAERLVAQYEGRLVSVDVSALNLRLNLKDAARFFDDRGGGYNMGRLVMKDGSEWALRVDSDRFPESNADQGWVKLQAWDEQGQQVLIDPAEVKTMYLGECEIKLE